ncbi:MAG: cysteine hydrolase [Spirochaetes bacterium]|nr:cysteine hydrolase [Spirochaetota bacterium]
MDILLDPENARSALVIVDMQRYYLEASSDYTRYFESLHQGCLDYIQGRCAETVIPNIRRLVAAFRNRGLAIVYLRLCGTRKDRSDLHRFFRDVHFSGMEASFENVYPLQEDPMSQVVEPLAPGEGDIVICKTTFSPFTSTDIEPVLRERGIDTCFFSGLATSQCVETSARDASDRGLTVVHVEDCQADYDDLSHSASLFASRGVCGGSIAAADEIISFLSK